MRFPMILVSTLAIAACGMSADAQEGEGSGRVTKQNFEVGEFDGVALAGSHDVVVTVGGANAVRAEGDAEIIEKLEITVENGTLRVGTKRGASWSAGFMRNRAPVTIYVTMPRITSAAVAGSGDMKVDKVEGKDFEASIAGSGDLEIASMRVEQADFSIAGSGDIKASGSTGAAKVSIAGSGDVDLGAVQARQANVSIVGSGGVQARASETADISIMGSGDVDIAGGARCTISKRGSGEVRCG
jgi:hypothetical protein